MARRKPVPIEHKPTREQIRGRIEKMKTYALAGAVAAFGIFWGLTGTNAVNVSGKNSTRSAQQPAANPSDFFKNSGNNGLGSSSGGGGFASSSGS